jgi:acetylornithine deacetylase/succinyl-diaminopimelate desuccinylase-like protein
VPPGEGWTRPPYDGVVENGRIYGRAAAVSKSDSEPSGIRPSRE